MDNRLVNAKGTTMESEENFETQENKAADDGETAADDSDDSVLTEDQEPETYETFDTESEPDTEQDDNGDVEEAAAADDTEEQETKLSSLIDCDTLPIDLRFEIARQSSTLAELSQLTVGSVVDLDKTPESVVDIYANGRLVGTAELVMVDGKVGVRIKSRR